MASNFLGAPVFVRTGKQARPKPRWGSSSSNKSHSSATSGGVCNAEENSFTCVGSGTVFGDVCDDDGDGAIRFGANRRRNFGTCWAAGAAGVCAAAMPDGRVFVDAGILGLRRRGILLGAGSLGGASAS